MQKKLQIAYSRREKLENLLKNLEKIKEKGTIDNKRYELLKKEYNEFLKQSEDTIQEVKESLKSKVEKEKQEKQALKQSLGNLEARFKVGEIIDKDYRKLKKPFLKKIQQAEKEIPQLEKFINSKFSSDVGGFINVKINKGKGLKNVIKMPNISFTTGVSSNVFYKIRHFFSKISSFPKKIAIVTIIILAIICLIVFQRGILYGEYVNIENKNDIIEIKKNHTFATNEYGTSITGKYRIEGKKIIFEYNLLGITFPSECALVRNGFNCEDGSKYKKK
ncbi:MAG: hypothetical protein U9P88_02100 [Patescibacteria group bacterium]|nr:hypothetical protein [Patescibacteria group bacterium]